MRALLVIAVLGLGGCDRMDVPQVQNSGGPVLAQPRVVPIFFVGDAGMQASVEEFLQLVPHSDYWRETTAEYGVGDLAVGPSIVTADPPPTTLSGLDTWLSAQLAGGQPGWEPLAPQTIYAVFLPSGTPFRAEGLGEACVDYGAFHSEIPLTPERSIVYAVMPRCSSERYSDLDLLTFVTSHELIEAATDPYFRSRPAYQMVDDDHAAWAWVGGGEVSDMCEFSRSAPKRLVGEYLVQRSWSNRAAADGHDPCVPHLAQPYLRAIPELRDRITLDDGRSVPAVEITSGASVTIDVALYSDGDPPPWEVRAYDVASEFMGSIQGLELTWDRNTGRAGDVLHLTMRPLSHGVHPFVITSRTETETLDFAWGFVRF